MRLLESDRGSLGGARGGGIRPILSVFILHKRKCPLETDVCILTLYGEEFHVGSEFISCGDANETVLKCFVENCHLVDSVAEVACLSQHAACDAQFPVEA